MTDQMIPAPPTLADMTMPERRACQWMQADVKGDDSRAVIVNAFWDRGIARVMWPGGFIEQTDWGKVTPRPDLPRLEWPGNKKPTPATTLPGGWRLANHKDQGRGVVTKPTPDRDGYVYFLNPSDTLSMGYDWHFCTPDELTYLDQEAADATDR